MKKVLLFCLFACFLAAANGQNASKPKNDYVEVHPSVVSLADWAGFPYESTLNKAKAGDIKAAKEFLEFHGTADGVDGLNHAVSCLELINVMGDQRFARACQTAKPRLLPMLLDRLQLAQGRTTKEALKKPLAEWAPNTWAVLNNKPLPGGSVTPDSSQMLSPARGKAKPGATDAELKPTTDNPRQ